MIALVSRQAKRADQNLSRAQREYPAAIERGIKAASIEAHAELFRGMSGTQRRDPFFGAIGADHGFLAVRTGGSRNRLSPGGHVIRAGERMFSVVGSPDRHVAFAEEGGTIHGHQFLRIPLAAAQTASGAEKGEFAGRSLRDVPGIFLKRSKGGRLFAVRQVRKGLLEFTHMLVRQVTKPARHLFRNVKTKIEPRATQLVGGEVSVVTRRANG